MTRTMEQHSRHAMAVALVAIGALAPATSSLARPAYYAASSTKVRAASTARHHPLATSWVITFTNPLGRSRGTGAGAGLL